MPIVTLLPGTPVTLDYFIAGYTGPTIVGGSSALIDDSDSSYVDFPGDGQHEPCYCLFPGIADLASLTQAKLHIRWMAPAEPASGYYYADIQTWTKSALEQYPDGPGSLDGWGFGPSYTYTIDQVENPLAAPDVTYDTTVMFVRSSALDPAMQEADFAYWRGFYGSYLTNGTLGVYMGSNPNGLRIYKLWLEVDYEVAPAAEGVLKDVRRRFF